MQATIITVIIIVVILLAVGVWMYGRRGESIRLAYTWKGMNRKPYPMALKWEKRTKYILRDHKELTQYTKNKIKLFVSLLRSNYGDEWRIIYPLGRRDVFVSNDLDNIIRKHGITKDFLQKHKRIIDSILVD